MGDGGCIHMTAALPVGWPPTHAGIVQLPRPPVQFSDNGMLSLIASHARVKAPWVQPCGLLGAKEFVLVADRLVLPRGQVVPGAGAGAAVGLAGRQVSCAVSAG